MIQAPLTPGGPFAHQGLSLPLGKPRIRGRGRLPVPPAATRLNRVGDEFLSPEGDLSAAAGPAERDRPAPRRGYRILYPLLGLLIFAALAPLASFAWNLLSTSREMLAVSQQELQLLLVSSIASQLDSHVDGIQGRIEALSSSFGALVQAQGLDAVEKDLASRPVLGNLLDENLVSLRFVTARGRSYEARSAGLMIPPELDETIHMIAESGFASAGTRGTVSSPRLLEGEGSAAVVVAAPIVTSAGVKAMLIGVADISQAWERIVNRARTGYTVYAIDRDGRLFAHTGRLLGVDESDLSGIEIVQRYLKGAGRNKETMLFTVSRQDGTEKTYLGSYESTSRGWGIFVQVEEHYAYALVRQMVRDTVKWSLGAIIVATLMALGFAGKLSLPVRKLTDAARRFAGGDFTVRAHVSGRDEIGELAETFNRMAQDIESYIRRVQEAARENNELFMGTIKALAEAIDAKDPYTRGHSVRVNRISVVIARTIGLESRAVRDIHVASLLHDVGKIGIDDSILKKPGNLTPAEYETMKQHPEKGARIMSRVARMKNIIPGMRHHHEKFIGGGYPMGLSGDEIPLAARIITLADVLDAMVSKRPYGQPMSFTAARARLQELKGSVLDPQVVEAFNRAFEAGEFASEERWSARLQNGGGDSHEEEPYDEDTLTKVLTSESAQVPAGAAGS